MRKWQTIKEYEDIKFDFFEGIAKITINRPRVYNAFRPQTNKEMLDDDLPGTQRYRGCRVDRCRR